MGHEITGCLLVKLFALHTSTKFRQIFPPKKKPKKKPEKEPAKKQAKKPTKKPAKKKKKPEYTVIITGDERKFNYEEHISDWILVVSSLLHWH